MTTDMMTDELANIGSVAGMIWTYLDVNGSVTLSKLAKEIDVPRDLLMQGVGWLAREGKVQFTETPRSRMISLT